MSDRFQFYESGVREFLSDRNARLLICGGGERDRQVFSQLGFRDVTISNLDTRLKGDEFSPYAWKFENAEDLSYQDNSFDFVVIHAAVHHSSSPHRVLAEMYRVCRKGILVFESRDSLVVRMLEFLGVSETFEHTAVYNNDCRFGGVNNSDIPNYVYRWTEREVEKTIQAYAPYGRHTIRYRYGTAFPAALRHDRKGGVKTLLLRLFQPIYSIGCWLFPRQQNLFAFYIEKLDRENDLFPWLQRNSADNRITFNKAWGDARFGRR